MISILADPYDWECDYSILARSMYRAGFPTEYMATQTYMNDSHARPVIGFQGNIQFLVDNLPLGSNYSIKTFIRHSWFHLYKHFLEPNCKNEILRYLISGHNAGQLNPINALSEQVGGRHEYLMYCADCVADDKEKYGEAFWHLDHQIAGNLVCSEHGNWLEASEILIASRKFIPASSIEFKKVARKLDLNSSEAEVRLYLAKSLRWLLQYEEETDFAFLAKRYKKLLFSKGFATFNGSIRMKQLNESIAAFFPEGFLEKLGSGIEGKNPRNWLCHVINGSNNQHPIRHLLLLYFLEQDPSQFFCLDTEINPFGEPSWPCLNPICDYYHQEVISSIFVGVSRKANRRPVAKFCCPECGFTYTRVGPDENSEDRFRGKVISYGSKWDNYFRQLWGRPDLTLKEKAKLLNIGYETLIRQAKRLRLIPSAELSNELQQMSLAEQRRCLQERWLEILDENPSTGIAELINEHGDVYWALYGLDAEWLFQHSPDARFALPDKKRDWAKLDSETYPLVEAIVNQILAQHPAKRVTANLIGQMLGWRDGVFGRNLREMPKTRHEVEKYLESHEDFAIRRIKLTGSQYSGEMKLPPEAEFIKRAGLSPAVRTERVMKQLKQALQELKAIVNGGASNND